MLLVALMVMVGGGYHNNVKSCVEEERLALLAIKAYMQSYVIPNVDNADEVPWYSSRDTNDCCKWYGIRCNVSTGRVIELDLGDKVNREEVDDPKPWMFNVTLFRPFKQLISLDLSDNEINGLVEHDGSTKISTLKNLRVLRLDFNSFEPGYFSLSVLKSLRTLSLTYSFLNESMFQAQGICKLRNLVELQLKNNQLYGVIPSCFKNLSSLQILDLSLNNLKGKIPEVLSGLRSLKSLILSENHLQGKFSLTYLANLSQLKELKLSSNMLEVGFGDLSWQPKFQLQSLGLSGCNLNKTFEAFPNFLSYQTNLSELDLSSNNLVQQFPIWLFNNSPNLRALNLSNNSLTGNFLPRGAQLPLWSNNNFHDKLPEKIGFIFPQLLYLNLLGNHFEGPIPTSIAHIRELLHLDLSNNNFSGELPRPLLRNCSYLLVLQLSDNNIEGDIIPEDMNLPYLQMLGLSNNNLGGTIKNALLRSSDSLSYLDMSNNHVTGRLPSWIGNFSSLYFLSMSQNNLQGQIPTQICNPPLRLLDLSHNNFSGSIPSCPITCPFSYMHLQNNSLSQAIPNTLSSCSKLITLDLSNNQLSGGLPLWINNLSSLKKLMLAGNNLYGPIPQQFLTLDEAPFSTIYDKLDEVEFLNKNQYLSFNGQNILTMSLLDLSSNKLTGDIPSQLGKLEQLRGLNLSHNFLSGSIPSQFSNLKQVESLDLSFNHLSGEIPSQLVELNFLGTFNVSYNNLSGRVPNIGQFDTFDEMSFYGNPGLYGYLKSTLVPPSIGVNQDEDEDEKDGHQANDDIQEFLWSFSISCVIMFLASITILYINPRWRRAWFEFVDYRILWRFPKFKLNLY
ncbi:Receptor-like protein 9b [Bienertia sinuspersici]